MIVMITGNIYWCKSIANFIKERDVDELKGLLSPSTRASANPLKDLVLCRMERLSSDLILTLKHISVIGHEFNESLVAGIMSTTTTTRRKSVYGSLSEQLTTLEKKGFIYLLEEHPVPIYGFQNELIRNTLYELLPPGYVYCLLILLCYFYCCRDAAAIHNNIALFIEREFENDLRPFYPT